MRLFLCLCIATWRCSLKLYFVLQKKRIKRDEEDFEDLIEEIGETEELEDKEDD